jgi:hypothetical protein
MTDLAFLNKMKARFPTLYPESDHALAVDCPPGWERLLWECTEMIADPHEGPRNARVEPS